MDCRRLIGRTLVDARSRGLGPLRVRLPGRDRAPRDDEAAAATARPLRRGPNATGDASARHALAKDSDDGDEALRASTNETATAPSAFQLPAMARAGAIPISASRAVANATASDCGSASRSRGPVRDSASTAEDADGHRRAGPASRSACARKKGSADDAHHERAEASGSGSGSGSEKASA